MAAATAALILGAALLPACTGGDENGTTVVPSRGADPSSSVEPTTPPDTPLTESVTIDLGLGSPTAFDFGGVSHEAELVRVVGSSADVVFSSDPVQVTLTVGAAVPVDLDDDAVPDATATLTTVSASGASVEVAEPPVLEWDETGFTTAGDLAPLGLMVSSDPSLVEAPDGTIYVFYAGTGPVRWERYDPTGPMVTAPRLGVGVLPRWFGSTKRIWSADAAAISDGFVVAEFVNGVGAVVTKYDGSMHPVGSPLVAGPGQQFPNVVAVGDTIWMAASGHPDGDVPTDRVVILTEIDASGPLAVGSAFPITDPPLTTQYPEKAYRDSFPKLALDEDAEVLAVAYKREPWGTGDDSELRVAGVELATGDVLFDSLVQTPWRGIPRGNPGWDDLTVAASDGLATIYADHEIVTASSTHQPASFVHRVDLSTGDVTQVAMLQPEPVDLRWPGGDTWHDLAYLDGQLTLLGAWLHYPVRTTTKLPRFVLWPLSDTGHGEPTVLQGGFPLSPDLVLDLNAFRQNPLRCIVGRACIFEGSFWNRGTRSASSVEVDVAVDGTVVGTISVGSVSAGRVVPFAADWTPEETLTAEQVTVRYSIRTSTQEYTTDNNAYDFTAEVRQKGVVFGRVQDISLDMDRDSEYAAMLPGVTVTVDGTSQLTGPDGFFSFEELEFGTYTVAIEKEGYKPLSAEVTLSRTDPIAWVPFSTDDHGILTVHVVDQDGEDLSGASVYLVDAGRKNVTGSDGLVTYDISKGTYRFVVTKRGHESIVDHEAEVVLGQERSVTFSLPESSVGIVSGQVFDRGGAPVGGVGVVLSDADGPIRTITADSEGRFGPIELPADPPQWYKVEASSGGQGGDFTFYLWGGDVGFAPIYLMPPAGSIKGRAATEGFTSWMIKAGWPGFMKVSGTDMYVWYGNYAIEVGVEYWDDTEDVSAVNVTVQGVNYEAHATKSEIDFTDMSADYGDLFEVTELDDDDWVPFVEEVADAVFEGADVVISGVQDMLDQDDAVVLGQGPDVLTWKESKEDFVVIPEPDLENPILSIWEIATSIPDSWAIPIVWGGASPELSMVRVDHVMIVHAYDPSVVLWEKHETFSSHQGPDGLDLNENGRHWFVAEEDIDMSDALVLVYLTVGKINRNGEVHGTCFDQREQQVVMFRPYTRAITARVVTETQYGVPSHNSLGLDD